MFLLDTDTIIYALMETFGSLKADLERRGSTVDDFDLVIASTALVFNYTLVTNNERHFRFIPGLRVENWTRPPGPPSAEKR
jgi:tRNA(fMet)-specific endonuclease VapC